MNRLYSLLAVLACSCSGCCSSGSQGALLAAELVGRILSPPPKVAESNLRKGDPLFRPGLSTRSFDDETLVVVGKNVLLVKSDHKLDIEERKREFAVLVFELDARYAIVEAASNSLERRIRNLELSTALQRLGMQDVDPERPPKRNQALKHLLALRGIRAVMIESR